MTMQQMYKECERLFREVDWNDAESVRRYNEAVKQIKKMREEQSKKERDEK